MNHDLYYGNLQLSGWRWMGKQRGGHGTKCRELARRQQCWPVALLSQKQKRADNVRNVGKVFKHREAPSWLQDARQSL